MRAYGCETRSMVWINIATATAVARLSCRLQARLLGINRLASSASFAWIFGGVFRGFSAGRLPLVGGRWRHRLFRPPQRPRCAYPRKGGYEDAFCSDIKKAQELPPFGDCHIHIYVPATSRRTADGRDLLALRDPLEPDVWLHAMVRGVARSISARRVLCS